MQRIFILLSWLTGLFLLFIGFRFLLQPEAAELAFGIDLSTDQNHSFHYIKGIRDLFCGLFLCLLLYQRKITLLGWYLIVATLIPITDAWIVLSYNDLEWSKAMPHLWAIGICLVCGLSFLFYSKHQDPQRKARERLEGVS